MTQKQCLLELCRQGWTSPLDLFKECGSMRFSGRIYDLKQEGYALEEREVCGVSRLGREISWKEFRLAEQSGRINISSETANNMSKLVSAFSTWKSSESRKEK